MKRTRDNVTVLQVKTVMYQDGAACPCCERPRVWRETAAGAVCGTGEDSGRVMSQTDVCWSCRDAFEYI